MCFNRPACVKSGKWPQFLTKHKLKKNFQIHTQVMCVIQFYGQLEVLKNDTQCFQLKGVSAALHFYHLVPSLILSVHKAQVYQYKDFPSLSRHTDTWDHSIYNSLKTPIFIRIRQIEFVKRRFSHTFH